MTIGSWEQLREVAKRDGLKIIGRAGAVTIDTDTLISQRLLTVIMEESLEEEDADRVVRGAIAGALRMLRAISNEAKLGAERGDGEMW